MAQIRPDRRRNKVMCNRIKKLMRVDAGCNSKGKEAEDKFNEKLIPSILFVNRDKLLTFLGDFLIVFCVKNFFIERR